MEGQLLLLCGKPWIEQLSLLCGKPGIEQLSLLCGKLSGGVLLHAAKTGLQQMFADR